MGKKYTISEISRQTGDSVRQLQRRVKDLVSIDKGKYLVDESVIPLLQSDDNIEASDDAIVVQEFTQTEYDELYKRLAEYPMLKEHISTVIKELDYHRKSSLKKDLQIEKILEIAVQRNYIEAKEKGLEN